MLTTQIFSKLQQSEIVETLDLPLPDMSVFSYSEPKKTLSTMPKFDAKELAACVNYLEKAILKFDYKELRSIPAEKISSLSYRASELAIQELITIFNSTQNKSLLNYLKSSSKWSKNEASIIIKLANIMLQFKEQSKTAVFSCVTGCLILSKMLMGLALLAQESKAKILDVTDFAPNFARL